MSRYFPKGKSSLFQGEQGFFLHLALRLNALEHRQERANLLLGCNRLIMITFLRLLFHKRFFVAKIPKNSRVVNLLIPIGIGEYKLWQICAGGKILLVSLT